MSVTPRDVPKAAWKGGSVSIHFSVPIFLPQNGSRKPEGGLGPSAAPCQTLRANFCLGQPSVGRTRLSQVFL